MPLEHGKSEEAFKHNVAELIRAGHPQNQALAIAYKEKAEDSAQQRDVNGFITIADNPISKSGVFQYSGRSLPDADPNKMYNVYRPEAELNNPETLKSFNLLPLINEHVMMGEGYTTPVEEKGMHGFTGEKARFENGRLLNTLRLVSDTMKDLIARGKRELSAGYRCIFEKSSGVFNGVPYDYIQRNIRGNHIALVQSGRSGKDIAVLDWAFDHFDLAVNEGEKTMSDAKTQEALDAKDAEIKSLKAKVAAMDAAEEERLKKEAEDKAAKDAAEEEEKKKKEAQDKAAKDSEEALKKERDKDKDAMDALESRLKNVEKRDTKAILRDLTARDAIVKEVSPIIGVFDHAEMTKEEVVAYACDKLELKPAKGQEEGVLAGFLAGRKAATKNAGIGFALDSGKSGGSGLLDKTLNKGKSA